MCSVNKEILVFRPIFLAVAPQVDEFGIDMGAYLRPLALMYFLLQPWQV